MTLFVYRKYIGQIYTDSLVHDEDALKYLVSTVGEDRVILGSDYPFPLGEHHPGKLIESIQDWDADLKVRGGRLCVDSVVFGGVHLAPYNHQEFIMIIMRFTVLLVDCGCLREYDVLACFLTG